MKIFSAEQIKRGDAYTIIQEPVSSVHLMERAAAKCAVAVVDQFAGFKKLVMLCGPGNNGGDGLAIARVLRPFYKEVYVFCFGNPEKRSFDSITSYNRLSEVGIEPIFISEEGTLDELASVLAHPDVLVGDALFGTGISRAVDDDYFSGIINLVNSSAGVIFSVDIPSGLFADGNGHFEKGSAVIQANKTFTFEQPKLSFLFAENAIFTGNVEIIPIGIHADFKTQTETSEFFITRSVVSELRQQVGKFSHKGTFGHALLVGGSKGKAGSIALTTKAAITSGAGLATALVTEKVLPVIQDLVPEAMCITSGENNYLAQIPALPKSITSIGIGPGMGVEKETVNVLKRLLAEINLPFVLDADALNILSENKTWISFLPAGTILTPHPKEFDRLTKAHANGYERWKTQVELSKRYNIFIVLKGAYSSVTTPLGKTFFNTTGNPGMSTGGSGDVLTGILTGLMAQGYPSIDTCLLGVFVHGLAGDLAYAEKGREALVASDIINKLGEAFQKIS
jgi:hydroxyethylthiazole kinase-like uncharacterized protein yjeF